MGLLSAQEQERLTQYLCNAPVKNDQNWYCVGNCVGFLWIKLKMFIFKLFGTFTPMGFFGIIKHWATVYNSLSSCSVPGMNIGSIETWRLLRSIQTPPKISSKSIEISPSSSSSYLPSPCPDRPATKIAFSPAPLSPCAGPSYALFFLSKPPWSGLMFYTCRHRLPPGWTGGCFWLGFSSVRGLGLRGLSKGMCSYEVWIEWIILLMLLSNVWRNI